MPDGLGEHGSRRVRLSASGRGSEIELTERGQEAKNFSILIPALQSIFARPWPIEVEGLRVLNL